MNSSDIIAEALRLGFDSCGIARAEALDDETNRLHQWLAERYHASMSYLERNDTKRLDPRQLVEGTRSVICVALNYYHKENLCLEKYRIARYAYGADYHRVVKDKLFALKTFIEKHVGSMPTARCFSDSAPILERAWAVRAGLGFIGKNNCLIIPRRGSFVFLGELLVPLELTPSTSTPANHCGKCHKCLDACPTKALKKPFTIDANNCLSYLTIEHKGSISHQLKNLDFKGQIFGCDICQEVCPYNIKFAKPTHEPLFTPSDTLRNMSDNELYNMSREEYEQLFSSSPIARGGYDKMHEITEIIKP